MAGYASEMKGAAIRVLHVKPLVYWTRFFVIITAFSRPQIEAMSARLQVEADHHFGREASGTGRSPSSWTLLDFGTPCTLPAPMLPLAARSLYPIVVHADPTMLAAGDVVVHIFLAPERAFYNLEEFYANAQEVPLPFESREQ
eukprot:SM006438S20495  [mRNA]  locus=s6438:374:802:+ [translate_table: standard]